MSPLHCFEAIPDQQIRDKLNSYSHFVENKLHPDLADCLSVRDKLLCELDEYSKLQLQLQTILDTKASKLSSMVDIGSDFYVQAKIPGTQFVYVLVGFGFHVQFTLPEAIKFIEKKKCLLEKQEQEILQDICMLRANIRVVVAAMREVMNLQNEKMDNFYEPGL